MNANCSLLTKNISITLLAIAGLYANASAAATYDAKNYPGANCQAMNGTQTSSLTHSNSGVYNVTASDVVVACPIVRDNIINQNGVRVIAYVENNGAANALYCKFYSNDQWGALVAGASANSPVGLNALGLSVLSSQPITGHYVFLCNLPPKSSVRSYQVYETLNTDIDS